MILAKKYPLLKPKSLIRYFMFFLQYFKTWMGVKSKMVGVIMHFNEDPNFAYFMYFFIDQFQFHISQILISSNSDRSDYT